MSRRPGGQPTHRRTNKRASVTGNETQRVLDNIREGREEGTPSERVVRAASLRRWPVGGDLNLEKEPAMQRLQDRRFQQVKK